MRAFVATIAIVACCFDSRADPPRKLVLFPVDRSIVDFDNDFSRRNPFYNQRAGAFYEIEYVAPSAESLFRIADVQAEQMPGTLDALRDFVYEWLDLYVRGNGTISQTERAKCIAQMDERLDSLFDAPLQRKLYRVWRDDESNEFRFLMISPGVDKRDNNPATVPKDAGEQSKISFQRWLALVSRLSTLLTHPRFSAPKGCTPTELLSII